MAFTIFAGFCFLLHLLFGQTLSLKITKCHSKQIKNATNQIDTRAEGYPGANTISVTDAMKIDVPGQFEITCEADCWFSKCTMMGPKQEPITPLSDGKTKSCTFTPTVNEGGEQKLKYIK